MLASNTVLQNRYRIVRQLGQGGMGTVYEAIDERVSCVVALKETLATNDAEARRAFEREAALLANLRHPLLPKVMDHFTEDEGQFLVMEFIHGYDLAELLDVRRTPFAKAQVLSWADELLKVLEYLHGRKPPILHGDIKPSNLKLTKEGEIFVLDFGLAKGAAGQMPTLMTSRSVRGYTPVYAPLEQIHGKGTDTRSDLYSLGATLYHLLTGVAPTDAPTRFTEIEDDRPDPLRLIDEVNPQLSPTIAAVIHQAMAVSRKHRPASATMMRSALREAEEETRRQEEAHRSNKQELEKQQAEQAARLHSDAEAAHRVTEDERLKQEEDETPHLREEQRRVRLAEEQHRRATEEEETRRRAEQTKAARNVVAPTQRAKVEDARVAAPSMKTLKGRPAHVYQNADALNSSRAGTIADQVKKETGRENNRVLLMAAAAVVGMVMIVAVGWLLLRGTRTNITTSPPASSTSAGKPFRNRNGIDLVWIAPGSFEIGSNIRTDEMPVHRVIIGQGFYMGKYEVTQGQWQAVMDNNPSTFKGDQNLPVESVSWDNAQNFINKLNEMNDGYKYRLPTEAEWEYACRAGTTTEFAFGSSLSSDQANFDGNYPYGGAAKGVYRQKTTPVGSFAPNAFGLFDMHGNVWEWCEDWYHGTYAGAPSDGSVWLSGGQQKSRVLRGGSWGSSATYVRSANRSNFTPDYRYTDNGFRLVAIVRTQ